MYPPSFGSPPSCAGICCVSDNVKLRVSSKFQVYFVKLRIFPIFGYYIFSLGRFGIPKTLGRISEKLDICTLLSEIISCFNLINIYFKITTDRKLLLLIFQVVRVFSKGCFALSLAISYLLMV